MNSYLKALHKTDNMQLRKGCGVYTLQFRKQHLLCVLRERHPQFHVKTYPRNCALKYIPWYVHELHKFYAIGNLLELLVFP